MERTQEQEYALVRRILAYVDEHDIAMDYYPGCAEIGYDDKPVLAANWNGPGEYERKHLDTEWGREQFKHKATLEKLSRIVDDIQHVSLEWSDKWTGCNDCGKAVRTSPDSYGWQASWVWASDSEIVCRECWKDSISDIIEFYMSDYHHRFSNKALPGDFMELLENEGFTCWTETPDECTRYETGLHPGQNDNPAKVFKQIMENDKRWEVVFVITDVGQFDIHWAAFVRLSDSD